MRHLLYITLFLLVLVGSVWAWTEPITVSASNESDYNSTAQKNALVVGPGGELHFVYFVDEAGDGYKEVYYKHYDGTSWSAPVQLSFGSNASHEPALAMDGSGNLTVVWYDYRLSPPYADLYWNRYDASTDSWLGEELLFEAPAGVGMYHPIIAAEDDGTLHLAWSDNQAGTGFEIYYSIYENGSWCPSTRLSYSNSRWSWGPAMVIDDYGTLHLMWGDNRNYGYDSRDYDIFYMTRSDCGVWSDETELFIGRGPRLAIWRDYLYVAYVVDDSANEKYIVYYSRKLLSDPLDEWDIVKHRISLDDTTVSAQADMVASDDVVRFVWCDGLKIAEPDTWNNELHEVVFNPFFAEDGEVTTIGPITGSHGNPTMTVDRATDMFYLIDQYSTTGKSSDNDLYFQQCFGPASHVDYLRPVQISLSGASYQTTTDSIRLSLDLEIAGSVEVAVYDLSGRRVGDVHSGGLSAGRHELNWDASSLVTGTYWVQATLGGESTSQPLVLVR